MAVIALLVWLLELPIYYIGKQTNQVSLHDITSGTNSASEFDSSNNLVIVPRLVSLLVIY